MNGNNTMVDSFLTHLRHEKRYSAKTVSSYEIDLNQYSQFIRDKFGDLKPEQVQYEGIRAWIVKLMESDIAPRSINRKIACLRSFYKFCIKRGILEKNPTSDIKILKAPTRLPLFVHEADMVKLLNQVQFTEDFEGKRDQLIMELLYGAGIRLSELIGLTESQMNLSECTIKVLGKRNKERLIPFPKTLVPIVKAYQEIRNKEVQRKDHGCLLVTSSGTPLYPMLVYRTVRTYLGLFTSLEKKSPHVLRHSFATHILNKGAEINAVKDLLGHSSLAATQVYTHNSIAKLKKVFDQAHPRA